MSEVERSHDIPHACKQSVLLKRKCLYVLVVFFLIIWLVSLLAKIEEKEGAARCGASRASTQQTLLVDHTQRLDLIGTLILGHFGQADQVPHQDLLVSGNDQQLVLVRDLYVLHQAEVHQFGHRRHRLYVPYLEALVCS